MCKVPGIAPPTALFEMQYPTILCLLVQAIHHMETHWSIAVVIPTVQISAPYPLTIVRFSSSHNYQDDPQYCALMEKVCSTLQQKFNL